jgi:hypothetical protein
VRELRLWAAAAAAGAAGFYALATLRHRRSLHPSGAGYQGQLLVRDDGSGRPGVPCSGPASPIPHCSASPASVCRSRCQTPLAWLSSCPTLTVVAPTRTCC